MRVCPKCGFEDPVCWHQNRWVSSVDYTRVEDFQQEYPDMADLQPGHVIGDAHCYYYRGKRNPYFVYRWARVLGPEYYTKSRHLTERHIPRAPARKGQSTLENNGVMAPKVEASV